ncbi:hypothetical protein C4D60_Mb04t25280 [Musa balbisiana]|uniref:Peptidase S9 prolyl oligopeptidase catalytic domain-containing protein n=1 Tax=Musa balbisiana TaxID=52838 RepID=A0A4S8KEN7_MUSBA|nr:hypothetical protein C4D60_Mb04t25280 [Musa balbisiana]
MLWNTMALILPFQGILVGGKTRRHSSIPIGSAAARAHGPFRCRTMETAAAAAAATDLRSDFLQVLRSRRRNPDVPLCVELGKPVKNPVYQSSIFPGSQEVMEACPKENVVNFKERLIEENIYLTTEEGEQGRLPVLILSLKDTIPQRKPAVVLLHSSYKCKEWLQPLLEALVSSWKNGDTMPFIYDTVWDLIKLADYLIQRKDIDPSRIGITGESLGGMHAWFAAAVDTRYSVVVPIIGVQGFRWALDNDKWQARVDSIKPVFEGQLAGYQFHILDHEACIDLGKNTIDKEVVKKVWDRIAPGLYLQFDAPYTIPVIAPRPLLMLNGAEDPRCPVPGLKEPLVKATELYKQANCPENLKFIAEAGIGHQMTVSMVKEASSWLDKFLK